MGRRDTEIAQEQSAVDRIYAQLDATRSAYRDRQRAIAAQPPGESPQARTERDVQAAHYGDQAQRLSYVEDRLVFGRLDPTTGEPLYIGRVGLSDDDHRNVLIDWRTPAARPFYQATARSCAGLARRRHLFVTNRVVRGIEDEVFDVEAAESAGLTLQGEGALMAALNEGRSGRMGDIVSTIQAEQDEIIRSSTRGLLVVQGGPGTGKTAVALHRAAYLLYAEAERLARSGVLIVGPSPTFLRYIEQVLPTLGETGVVSTTLGTLRPGICATASEDPKLAALKGDMRWVAICKAATRSLQRVPDKALRFVIDGITIELEPHTVADAAAHARMSHRTHNGGRATFVADVLDALTRSYMRAVRATGREASEADRGWIREEIRTNIDVRREVNLCWMPYAPDVLLRRLFSHPRLLAEVAGDRLSAAERAACYREANAPLTEADIVLIDELSVTLGEFVDPRRARHDAQQRREGERALTLARLTLDNAGFEDVTTTAEGLVARTRVDSGPEALAEQARLDPTWTYGHIVVDEAQELSPLAWNALLRRCPSHSFTVVGDLAQRHAAGTATSWRDLLGPAARALASEAVLTVCYRTPATIMAAAERVMRATSRATLWPTTPVRDVPDALELTRVDDVDAVTVGRIVDDELAELDARVGEGEGTLVVIADRQVHARLAETTGWGSDTLTDRVVLLTPTQAKGLEFDSVVLVEPSPIAAASPGDLYVAMTRPTHRLRVVSTGDFPAGMAP